MPKDTQRGIWKRKVLRLDVAMIAMAKKMNRAPLLVALVALIWCALVCHGKGGGPKIPLENQCTMNTSNTNGTSSMNGTGSTNGDQVPDASDGFRCSDGSKCINASYICDDGIVRRAIDCPDGSDESRKLCGDRCKIRGRDDFRSSDAMCIPDSLKCDGNKDCYDAIDESREVCGDECIVDIGDVEAKGFRCSDGQCILAEGKCDGNTKPSKWNISLVCSDGSDESTKACGPECNMINGTKGFSCSNGKCIPASFKCDGRIDCADGGDEKMDLCRDKCFELSDDGQGNHHLKREDIQDIKMFPTRGEVEARYSGVTLRCVVHLSPGSPKMVSSPLVRWYHKGTELRSQDGLRVEESRDFCNGSSISSTLRMTEDYDLGHYECRVGWQKTAARDYEGNHANATDESSEHEEGKGEREGFESKEFDVSHNLEDCVIEKGQKVGTH